MTTDIWIEAKSLNNSVVNNRIETCSSCENLEPHGGCNKCACYMPIKVTNLEATCPASKW